MAVLTPSRIGRAETIEETAALVETAGGRGIAVRTDHSVPAEVEALIRRIVEASGHLGVLVRWGSSCAMKPTCKALLRKWLSRAK